MLLDGQESTKVRQGPALTFWDVTYDNIHCFVQIHDHTVLVDDWDCRYGTLREHMDNVKYRGVERRSCDGPVWIMRFRGIR